MEGVHGAITRVPGSLPIFAYRIHLTDFVSKDSISGYKECRCGLQYTVHSTWYVVHTFLPNSNPTCAIDDSK